jgi:hypothetical protein
MGLVGVVALRREPVKGNLGALQPEDLGLLGSWDLGRTLESWSLWKLCGLEHCNHNRSIGTALALANTNRIGSWLRVEVHWFGWVNIA